MKTSRAVNVTRRNIDYNRDHRHRRTAEFIREYQLYTTNIQRQNRYDWTKDVGVQCNTSKMTGYLSPRRTEVVYHSGVPKQVYAYTRARSFTNIGVGGVYQQKKRVRKIYLPETEHRGVGSSDLSYLITDRKSRNERETFVYARNKMSSKCVGGAPENVKQCTEKLSPIAINNNTKASPYVVKEEKTFCKDTGNNTVEKNVANTTTQVENTDRDEVVSKKQIKSTISREVLAKHTENSPRYIAKKSSSIHKSSDSLEQHVHNLEDPSYIQSTGSSDPMENKLEKEYRKIFSSKNKEDKNVSEKPMYDLKSTSLLRRRFEALKRGIAKKEDAKKNNTPPSKESGQVIKSSDTPVHRDISVESDPPSLEARSYSHTKIFSPPPSAYKHDRRPRYPRNKSHTSKKDKDNHKSTSKDKADDADIKGMFKAWGEKFNFEDEKKTDPPRVSFETKEKVPEAKSKVNDPKTKPEDKKEGKRFFFFKKKSKDKTKPPSDKKGVTTGRCEVKNCTILNTHKEPQCDEIPKKLAIKSDEDDIFKKNWLKNFIQKTIESRKSLQIRWNNKTYTTSSSTVFELMDNMYRQANIVIRSQSEISTVISSDYESLHKHRVNFVQDIEAWMIPTLIPHRNVPYFYHRNEGDNRISDRKWFIDKSKAFAHEIELVLKSKNFVRCHRTISSDYLQIDIPTGYFTDPSSESDKFATSNSEEVYKIIEYESPESRSEFRYKVTDTIGDYSPNDVRISRKVSVRDKNIDTRVIETVIKKPPVHRDVVIQGSNVHIPKRCDVIGVGIITHRVNREMGKALINTEEEVSEDESEHLMENNIKQCQFAESYLRDYYRHWMPLGVNLFPERVRKCESQETMPSLHNQGDGTKSCPNIATDYSFNKNLTLSNSHGFCKETYIDKTKIFNTFKSTTQSEPPLDAKRILPKDSFEVLRKRMLYACGNRSKWNYPDDQPYSVPSIQDKAEQDALNEVTISPGKPRQNISKRVTNCDYPPECDVAVKVSDQKPGMSILSHGKKSMTSMTKHAKVTEDDNCVILPPPCIDHCNTVKNPKCLQKNSKNKSKDDSPKSKSPPKSNSPKGDITVKRCSPFNENLPCKRNSPCRETSRKSVNEYHCPCPCTTPLWSSPITQLGKSPSKESRPSSSKPSGSKPCCAKPCCSPKPIQQLPNLENLSPAPIKHKKLQSPPVSLKSSSSRMLVDRSQLPPIAQQQNQGQTSPTPGLQSPCLCTGCLKRSNSQISREIQMPQVSHRLPISTQTSPKTHILKKEKPCQISPCREPSEFLPCPNKSEGVLCPNALEDLPCPNAIEGLPCPNVLEDSAKTVCSQPKIGLHLKVKPSSAPKCHSECPKQIKKQKQAIETCGTPSEEQIVIRVKKNTHSSEDLRDLVNVKVQDEDGKTLFERRDYRMDHGTVEHKSSLLEGMYKVNTVSTASLENSSLKDNMKCEKSVSNMIEISFGVKVTQGDKLAEINLNGVNDEADRVETKSKDGKSQDVFIISSEAETTHDDPNDKNDINIKIIIKNFDTKNTKSSKKTHNDDFAKNISKKFQTVSTGYSDMIDNHIEGMYSMHRATIDLSDSKSQSLPTRTEEENEILLEQLQITRERLSKEAETIDNASMADFKAASQKETQSIHNSETYEVVNRSRENTEVTRSTISYDAPTLPISNKTSEGRKEDNTDICGNVDTADEITVCKSTKESKLTIRKSSTNEKSYKTEKNSSIKQIINGASIKNSRIGDFNSKHSDIFVFEKQESKSKTGIHLQINEDSVEFEDKIKELENCETIQKSEVVLKSRTESKSDTNTEVYLVQNKENLRSNSTITINKSKTSAFHNIPNSDMVETKSEIGKQSTESKMNLAFSSNIINKLLKSSEIIKSEVQSVRTLNDTMVSDMLESILQHEKLKFVAGDVLSETGIDKDMSKTMQSNTNLKRIASDEKIDDYENLDPQKSVTEKCDSNENENKNVYEFNYEKQPQIVESERNTDLESENENTDLNQSQKSLRLSHTDTDDPDNALELNITSDDTYDDSKIFTRQAKKEMLKRVFEKATHQKWKSKGRMKRIKNMLKFILTSDSSDVDDQAETSKILVEDITYSAFDKPSFIKDTDSMNNFYMADNIITQSDEDTSDTSDYQIELNKCLCQSMADRLRKRGEILKGGCCCKAPVKTVHEQTSCNINNENDLYMINYKAAEYIDVHTQHSVMSTKITNVMLVKKMESVMTSIRCSEFEQLNLNNVILPYKNDKECEAKDVKTNTVLGIVDKDKIVIRRTDPKKCTLKTEIIIDWKSKKKHKDSKKTYFTSPADILQSYETKKAVLEIYAKKTVTKEGERLVAKLPKFVYDTEQEIEKNYVNDVMILSQDRI